MKKFFFPLFLFFSASILAQNASDTAVVRRYRMIGYSKLDFQTHSYNDLNAVFRNAKFPELYEGSARIQVGARIVRPNSGWVNEFAFEYMNFLDKLNANNNRTLLSEYGVNFGGGYNFLHKTNKFFLMPYGKIGFLFRDLVLINAGSNTITLPNYLSGVVTRSALNNVDATIDLGVAFDFNIYKDRRFQNLLGFTAGYRANFINGFGDFQLFRVNDAYGNNTSINLGGFYAGITFSGYRLKPMDKIIYY